MEKCISVSMIQMCSGPDTLLNLQQADQLLANLPPQVDLIVLPECFALLGGDVPALGADNSFVKGWMSDTAGRHSAWLVGGSVPFVAREGEKSRSSCYVYSPKGIEVTRYDKIHLFDADVSDNTQRYRESDDYQPGTRVQTVDTEYATLGLSICYDLRFPELYRQLRSDGAHILLVPSAFTKTTGQAHWEPLLRARAIENQCYVVATNQCGVHPNSRETWGHSMIISPWGDVLAQLGEEPAVVTTKLNLSLLETIRNQMPCFEHRQLSL